jgi:hypothetical protein
MPAPYAWAKRPVVPRRATARVWEGANTVTKLFRWWALLFGGQSITAAEALPFLRLPQLGAASLRLAEQALTGLSVTEAEHVLMRCAGWVDGSGHWLAVQRDGLTGQARFGLRGGGMCRHPMVTLPAGWLAAQAAADAAADDGRRDG